ncbi:MAG: hypothetical protein IT376_14775 [Polyangiaceae bacterium]|nr:hypothetical protein [Polyangiaceae bacterium]
MTPPDHETDPADGPRRTLPPPELAERELPRSAASVVLGRLEADGPVRRRIGPRAELATLARRVSAARAAGDDAAEAELAATLARGLAARGQDLDEATRLARRSLSLKDDPALRRELSTWFAGQGEAELAAASLRPLAATLEGPAAAGPLLRAAALLARAGLAGAAADDLRAAGEADREDPTSLEMLAALAAWAPDVVAAGAAAEAYVAAHERRESAGDRAAAFEDLLRGFEADPSHVGAASRLATVLVARGRTGAADEVLREHARARPSGTEEVHRQRVRLALGDGDLPRALAAALDARLHADGDVRGALARLAPDEREAARSDDDLDTLLESAGLHELRAARLEIAATRLDGDELARTRAALARLYAGALGSSERAFSAWRTAVLEAGGASDVRAELRAHATGIRDLDPWTDTLIQLGRRPHGGPQRLDVLRELALVAEQRLDDAPLATWAWRVIAASGDDGPEPRAALQRLAPRAAAAEAELADARARLESPGSDRPRDLRRLERALRGHPDEAAARISALTELTELAPDDAAARAALERALEAEERWTELEGSWRRTAEHGPTRLERERACVQLALRRLQGDDPAAALAILEPCTGAEAIALRVVLAARAGRPDVHARALTALAASAPASARAGLLACAASLSLELGDVPAARGAAEQATRADPSLARAVAALAEAHARAPDASSPAVLERAMGVVVPRAWLCEALAQAHELADEPVLALAWTQRWLALRPGDARAARALLERVLGVGDGARIGDALSWLLSQTQALVDVSGPLCAALVRLAELDPPRGAALARRVLDVLGPRREDVRAAVVQVAALTGERGLGIAALERWAASLTPGAPRAEAFLDVAARRGGANDADGAARALCRAAREEADPTRVLAAADAAPPPRSADGELASLEARAVALTSLVDADRATAVRALRELGGARWDLADDPRGALEAWDRAAELDSEHGMARLAGDLVAFAGHDRGVDHLVELARGREDRARAAEGLAVAATTALHGGDPRRALALALEALEIDPTRADVLAVVERSAGPQDLEALERAYARLASAALGCYGVRAAHYRAARQLERRGQVPQALAHAVQAFDAVPAEGVTFVLMARLAERVGDPGAVVRAVSLVAARTRSAEQRAGWLQRAVAFAGPGTDGARQRVDVLLRALAIRPDSSTLRQLGAAATDLVAGSPEEREVLELRLRRATSELLDDLEGPEGARLGVEAARVALEVLGAADLALDALLHALEADADIDEYVLLEPALETLTAERELASRVVARVIELASPKWANVGTALTDLAAALAVRLGDSRSAARVLVLSARRDPHDTERVARAREAALASGDPDLAALVLDAVPPTDRARALTELAAAAERNGDGAAAEDALSRALELEGLPGETRGRIVRSLASLFARSGKRDAVEALLARELDAEEADLAATLALARDLAATIATRGEPARALALVERMLSRAPGHPGLLEDRVEHARQMADRERLADALAAALDAGSTDPEHVVDRHKELARLLEATGQRAAAAARWRDAARLAPDDPDVLAALEQAAEAEGDHERLVELLARRASSADKVDEVRRLRLRRALVLEQKLARSDDARAELEALIAATGDHLPVLRVLADLHERLGAPQRAAPLWLRASAIARDRAEAADLARRAGEAHLASGDVEGARRVLEGLEAWSSSERVLQLRVEIERRGGQPLALAAALDDLAAQVEHAPVRRGELLLESSRASERGGDLEGALQRAERAARLARDSAEAVLHYHALRARLGRQPSVDQARVAVAELRRLPGPLAAEDLELRAWLVSELLGSIAGDEAAVRELERAKDELGPRPLLALGLAERRARSADPSAALQLFERALDGDLRGLRQRGAVALAAARAAHAAGRHDAALAFAELASRDPALHAQALAMAAELRAERGRAAGQLAPDRGAARSATPAPVPAPVAEPAPRPADPRREPDAPDPAAMIEQVAPARRRSSRPPPPVAAPARRDSSPVLTPPPGAAVVNPRLSALALSAPSEAEGALWTALLRGSVEAGRELVLQLESRADRRADLAAACRKLAWLRPGDAWTLAKLHEAALADGNPVHARAVEHVLRLLDPSQEPLEAPPLADQNEQPTAVRALLWRDVDSAAGEALAIVWEGADHVFRRDPSTYGVTGHERVPLSSPTPVGRAYAGAARLLGAGRTPLFQRRSTGPVTVSVALVSPPALILTGEPRKETPALRFHIGATLAAALPEHALLHGSGEAQARSILAALRLAFGPPGARDATTAAGATLAEVLWESIPTRLQRRLRDVCQNAEALDYDLAVTRARTVVRRAGLLAAGDLGVALQEVCAEEGVPWPGPTGPDSLAALAAASPAVADLVRLATSAEYAEVRWQFPRPGRAGTWA